MKMSITMMLFLIFSLLYCSCADIYMQNPRGSNDRNREQNQNRNNANRLFNSQNNAKGGYAWAGNPTFQGQPDPLTFYAKSKIRLEWTVQHGCGPHSNAECDFIIQYMAEDVSLNVLRDGYPSGPLQDRRAGYKMATFTDSKQNADGTNEFPLPTSFPGASGNQFDATDPSFGTNVGADTLASNLDAFCKGGTVGTHKGIEFGYHESCESYRRCTTTSRNKGLYTADRNLGGNSARFTRQNNNGNRHGLECPEEREYYPYWRPSEWRDIAILTSNASWCAYAQQESQNLKSKFYCQMPTSSTDLAPISKAGCDRVLGTWIEVPSWGLNAPDCVVHATSRDNHLGNTAVDTFGGHSQPTTAHYDWTIPESLRGKRVVLRFRYNMSASTYESHADFMSSPGKMTDASMNCQAGQTGQKGGGQCGNDLMRDGPVALYNNPYVKLWDNQDGNDVYLALAINTAQVGRTFQDRSFVFEVRSESPKCAGQVYNLNIRGKRGNIVQTYPATEYDFVPSLLEIGNQDCIDFQWAGSDFNAQNQDGEGADQTDRHNFVEVRSSSLDPNSPDYSHLIPQAGPRISMFAQDDARLLAYANQTLGSCADLTADDANNDERVDNCAKLNAAPNVYRHPNLLTFASGSYSAISTRNNNFSNRQQKFHLIVTSSISTGIWIAVGVVGAFAVATIVACCVARRKPKSTFGRAVNAIFMGRRAFKDKYEDLGPDPPVAVATEPVPSRP